MIKPPRLKTVERKEELSNILPMKRSLVGLDGGIIPPGTDWLSELPEGTEFLCKMISATSTPPGQPEVPRFILQVGLVVRHIGKARWVKLSIKMPDGRSSTEEFPVDPKAFCKVFEKFEIVTDELSDKFPTEEPSDWPNKPE